VDAFATPFVQGQLRKTALSVTVNTECAHCSRPMELTIDSDLNWRASGEGCDPIVFSPTVDLFNLEADSIIDAF
jgi:hypothetical protein